MHTHDALAIVELPLSLNNPQAPAFALTTTILVSL